MKLTKFFFQKTALHVAAKIENADIIKLLLHHNGINDKIEDSIFFQYFDEIFFGF